VKRVCLALVGVAAAGVLAGCAISDPTENTFAPQIVNDTKSPATVVYCDGSSSCKPNAWKETLRSGKRTSENISAGRGALSVFVVTDGGNTRCIRLSRYTKAIRLSEANPTACHPPYG
jgi:hypothetical protein